MAKAVHGCSWQKLSASIHANKGERATLQLEGMGVVLPAANMRKQRRVRRNRSRMH
jgi:hypothetical protein